MLASQKRTLLSGVRTMRFSLQNKEGYCGLGVVKNSGRFWTF